jgi:hypothetical protein
MRPVLNNEALMPARHDAHAEAGQSAVVSNVGLCPRLESINRAFGELDHAMPAFFVGTVSAPEKQATKAYGKIIYLLSIVLSRGKQAWGSKKQVKKTSAMRLLIRRSRVRFPPRSPITSMASIKFFIYQRNLVRLAESSAALAGALRKNRLTPMFCGSRSRRQSNDAEM